MREGKKKEKEKKQRENSEIKFLTQLIRARGRLNGVRQREYSMEFKEPTSSEQIGDPLEKNHSRVNSSDC